MRNILLLLLLISSFAFGFTETDRADIGTVSATKNSGFEQGVLSWNKYNDSAATPVDGTGGSASSTLTSSSSSPIYGAFSGVWAKTANNRQGEGFAQNVKLPANSLITLTFDYAISSGTYADDDMRVFIYDVTGNTMITPFSGNSINNHLLARQTHIAQFNTTANTSYRILIHTYSSDATRAYNIKFDNFWVGVKPLNSTAIITPWTSYTPTFTGFGTVSVVFMQSRRNGDSLEVKGGFQCGTSTATQAQMTLGFNGANTNVTIDTVKKAGAQPIGMVWVGANAASSYNALTPNTSPNNYIVFGSQSASTNAFTNQNGNSICSSGNYVGVDVSIPIAGWSSNIIFNEGQSYSATGLRLSETVNDYIDSTSIIMHYSTVSGTASSSYTVTPGAGFNSGTGVYSTNPKVTIGETGWYFISFSHRFTYPAVPIVNRNASVTLYKNNSAVEELALFSVQIAYSTATKMNGSTIAYLKAGDYIDLRWFANFGVTTSVSGDGDSILSISKFSIPQAVLNTDPVVSSYTGIPSGVPSSTPLTVAMPTKLIDTHNAYSTSTGIFTAPRSGMLKVSARVGMTGTIIGTSYIGLTLLNGATTIEEAFKMDFYSTSVAYGESTFAWIPVLSGDQIKVRAVAINIAGSAWISGCPTYYHLDFEMK